MATKTKKRTTITTFDEHLDTRYGKSGLDELANKTGTKKSFISRIENGHSDIQLSTLFKLIELGLGRKVSLTIE